MVGLETVPLGGERRDDELVRVEGAVGYVEPPVGRPAEYGVLEEYVLADDVLDKAGVPELPGSGELVLVPPVALVVAGPGAGQAGGQTTGEAGQVGSCWKWWIVRRHQRLCPGGGAAGRAGAGRPEVLRGAAGGRGVDGGEVNARIRSSATCSDSPTLRISAAASANS